MSDLIESMAYSLAVVLAFAVMKRVTDRLRARKGPEQRKAEEQWEWRHGRW